jgi:hypothetical protein
MINCVIIAHENSNKNILFGRCFILKDIKWVFVLYSLAAVAAMCGIGIAVGMRSIPVAIIAILALIFVMGNGFKTKKKMREQGIL